MPQIIDRRTLLLATPLLAAAQAPASLGAPPPGFTSAFADVEGARLHYVRGGSGPPILLMHGFPEDWTAYRAVMPKLAARFTVVAVDMPGIGRSAPSPDGYAAANLAGRLHALATALKLERPYLVGHDLGAPATYAYVRRFPDAVRGVTILDVPMAGIPGAEDAGKGLWHVGFIQTPGLPEKLVPGRQEAFLGWFYDLGKFTPQERAYYAKVYGAAQLHAAFEVYRALPKDAEWISSQTAPNNVPLVVAVGAKSLFEPFLGRFVDGYRAKGMTNVTGERIADAGHYVMADNPDGVAALIAKYASG